ncbi:MULTISPECIES: branched-chain amino acid ABC transporter permease [Pseudomonas]|uniref:Amino acid/amide ABC transporter membrane protein 2, HAAT family n=1 Tax=Pseudomonas asplenii TaxID=53407 RepID=A0A0M9GCI0_9PSED|nr:MULTISPECIES: ABC transporter ATP-binding protein [Pseudomonas]KPA87578.1 amino acid/amide ABC transporter membrane protein 2, HAAT family [Pseudomonas fuscovaginae]KPA94304.1 ABC-type branched-chain amino acid transport system, permease component [Pseudomonas fuscovaginae]
MTVESILNNTAPRAKLGLLLFAAALLLAPWLVGQAGGNAWVRTLDFALLYIMLALGLNIVVGYAGLLDMGFIAFYAVGAYLAALLSSPHLLTQFPSLAAALPGGMHAPLWLILPLAALLAAGLGILLGAPTLRLRGDYLAIVTLGFGEIIRIFMRNLDRPINLTNGPKGISSVDPLQLWGVNLARTQELFGLRLPSVYLYYYLFAALMVAILFTCIRLQRSRIGRAWLAIREDEQAAEAMGLNTRNLKLLAFAIGAAFGGVSGALFASFQGFVSPESFTLNESIAVLAMVVLGGMGHVPGVILGCVLLAALPEVLRASTGSLQQALFGQVLLDPEIIRQLFYGLALILAMLYRPAGLWPAGNGGAR